ncbi:LysM-like peptidoglycan-binding domain-containing protein [Mannheimia varigena]|uniref:LysM-like peptidoglycan-binding domain-containing protein n=1 Tax=Mannheimia varigena TaxID=85404 RepID=UPI0015B42572|nr:LysM-like peptidoglycan-binding domain-containing protein [Mannheimia varigena]QLD32340.1 opacity-associated protein A [Mannheimia varigena]
MTQNNFRKEPVFGEPLTPNQKNKSQENEKVEPVQVDSSHSNRPYVSLHSTKAPGHTFTPIMKRSDAPVEDKTADAFTAKPTKEFQFTPSTENVEAVVKNVKENPSAEGDSATTTTPFEVKEKAEPEVVVMKPTQESFTTERIIPNAATTAAAGATMAATAAVAATKTKDIKENMPPKTRRLLLVSLLGLALLVLFFLLKPSTPETVEELQSQQGGSLPIEFRPVDEAEAKRAEEQARAEQEAAKAQEQAQAQAQEAQQKAQSEATTAVAPVQTEQVASNQVQNNQPQTTQAPVVEQSVAVKPVQNKPVVPQSAIKPKTEGSVVFQPETTPKHQPKVERVATQSQKESTKVVAKPAEKASTKSEAAKTNTTSAVAVSTKTMTVPKGVSLMQVFRDNNLNISDVNTMSKVNNVVSNLKVGERVTVRLDKNNRVVEMSIGSGGKFTRQANGSYTFK